MRRLKTLLAAPVLLALCASAALKAQGAKSADVGPGAFLNISGAKSYYEECGNSPQNVVLLHDGVLHSVAWDDVWRELCKKFHVIRYDRHRPSHVFGETQGIRGAGKPLYRRERISKDRSEESDRSLYFFASLFFLKPNSAHSKVTAPRPAQCVVSLGT
jgi:hypothetical protein